jgi:hypothetical protein
MLQEIIMTLRKISKTELDQILDDHRHWLESNGQEGSCADLSNTNLRGVVLEGADLQFAYLKDADLVGANLRGANLYSASLDGADLRGAKLDRNILDCFSLDHTKWLKSDIPWFIQHPGYNTWADTILILDE